MEMTSTRPYLIRAIYEWILENRCTPYLLADATAAGVRVPPQAIKDGQVVLNLAPMAIDRLDLGLDEVRFHARFSGQSLQVTVPVSAVLAIYAKENAQGMMFPPEEPSADDSADSASTPAAAAAPGAPVGVPAAPVPAADPSTGDKPDRARPSLRIVK